MLECDFPKQTNKLIHLRYSSFGKFQLGRVLSHHQRFFGNAMFSCSRGWLIFISTLQSPRVLSISIPMTRRYIIIIYIYKFPWVTDRYIICLTKSYSGLKKYIVWVSNLQPFVGHDFHVLRQAIAQAIIIDGSLGWGLTRESIPWMGYVTYHTLLDSNWTFLRLWSRNISRMFRFLHDSSQFPKEVWVHPNFWFT